MVPQGTGVGHCMATEGSVDSRNGSEELSVILLKFYQKMIFKNLLHEIGQRNEV